MKKVALENCDHSCCEARRQKAIPSPAGRKAPRRSFMSGVSSSARYVHHRGRTHSYP